MEGAWFPVAYRLAGISILSCGGSSTPSTIGRLVFVVCCASLACAVAVDMANKQAYILIEFDAYKRGLT